MKQKLFRFKLQIFVLAIAAVAAGAGLYIAGIVGPSHEKTVKKLPIEDISFVEPFIVNVAGKDENLHYIKLRLAVSLEPMAEADHAEFGLVPEKGHGGGESVTGKMRLASDATLRDAVNVTVAQFTADDLVTPEGKQRLKKALLTKFAEVASDKTPHPLADGKGSDAAYAPYHIEDVYFEDFQVS